MCDMILDMLVSLLVKNNSGQFWQKWNSHLQWHDLISGSGLGSMVALTITQDLWHICSVPFTVLSEYVMLSVCSWLLGYMFELCYIYYYY